MSGHEQENMLSTNVRIDFPRFLYDESSHHMLTLSIVQVHAIFGYTLMAAGVCRIIEICFVLKEGHKANSASGKSGQMSAFQHLTPFLLIVGG